ncbi:mandelate racemase/muconate lactonizing enzyme family protein [Desulfitibacter alkalitolerans]|uniref:mandelate racemase/muconate lactonizing enzyme family protein n=1 Tax=Desulfitibacter alkalitolerans TaxID=264641 RepID=UPI000688622C|nr:mandelate racemase/muconate lactonizing enzyme family protein [Desulfitibacter alkalitolerans]
MKIVDVRTTELFYPFRENVHDAARQISGRDVLLVEIITDEGVNGIGFLTGLGVAHGSEIPVINTIIHKGLKPMVLDQDPFTIEKLWQKMYLGTTRYGRKGAAVRAISGIDMALWDLVGKTTNTPVYKLLGGYADKIKVYASGGFYTDRNDPAELVEEMLSYLNRGFNAVKMKVGRDLKKDIQRVKIVREAVGSDIDLLVDANEAWDVGTSLKFIKGVEDYNIFWLEEPLAPDDIDGLVQLTQRSSIPIAAGENEYTRYGFKDLISRSAVSVVQPDVTRVGGISEWMKVASMASAWNMPCVTHAVQEVHISLVTAISNAPMMEYFTREHYLQTFLSDLFIEPSLNEITDGYVKAPQKPGLGLEVDWELANKFKV